MTSTQQNGIEDRNVGGLHTVSPLPKSSAPAEPTTADIRQISYDAITIESSPKVSHHKDDTMLRKLRADRVLKSFCEDISDSDDDVGESSVMSRRVSTVSNLVQTDKPLISTPPKVDSYRKHVSHSDEDIVVDSPGVPAQLSKQAHKPSNSVISAKDDGFNLLDDDANKSTRAKPIQPSLFVPFDEDEDSSLSSIIPVAMKSPSYSKGNKSKDVHETGDDEDTPSIVRHDVILSSSSSSDDEESLVAVSHKAPKQLPENYEFDKRLITTSVGHANPFLKKLIKNASTTREKHDHLRKQRERERLDEQFARSIEQQERDHEVTMDVVQEEDETIDFTSSPDFDEKAPSSFSFSKNKVLHASTSDNQRSTTRTVSSSSMNSTTTRNTTGKKTPAEKRLEKEELRRWKDANTVTRKKEDLLSEMVISIPDSVLSLIKSKQCEEILFGIEIREYHKGDPFITWQRKVNAEYDQVTDSFMPTSPRVIEEDKCCLVYDAKDFVTIMSMETILNKLNRFKKDNPRFSTIVIMLIGWDQLVQKVKNAENRRYTERIRGSSVEDPNKRRKKKQSLEEQLNLEELETTLAQLKVYGFRIFTTKNVHETTVWLQSFTYAIAQARYDKLVRHPEFANVGNIKSGKDIRDTYFKMLLELKFVTEPRAKRITNNFPSLSSLYQTVQQCNGRLPYGDDGRAVMNTNIESTIIKLFKSHDDKELLHMD